MKIFIFRFEIYGRLILVIQQNNKLKIIKTNKNTQIEHGIIKHDECFECMPEGNAYFSSSFANYNEVNACKCVSMTNEKC